MRLEYFQMVDRIIALSIEDGHVCAAATVPMESPIFEGHFPDHPIMPGVLLVECMAQTAGALCVLAQEATARPKVVYFMTIDKAKFRKPVVPGDTVEYHVRKIRRRANIWRFAAEARVDGGKVAEAEVSAMLVDS